MNGKLKEQAKKQLKSNWPASVVAVIAVCVCVILVVNIIDAFYYVGELIGTEQASDICGQLSFVLAVVAVFMLMPFWLGFKRFCYIIAKTGKAELSDMFRYVTNRSRYEKALAVGFSSLWRFLTFFGLFCVPSLMLAYLLSLIPVYVQTGAYEIFGGIFLFIAFVLAILICRRYALAHYIFFENEELSSGMCFSYARNIYRRQRHSMITLTLSFFPWYLLSLLVLPLLYVMPYASVTSANFAKWTVYNYLKENPDPVIPPEEEYPPEIVSEEEIPEVITEEEEIPEIVSKENENPEISDIDY